ncbi:hypothetical protein H7F13_11100 [Proteus vulgaris]|nr:hypothetical protein H7F13_11100 [Proteus vulgaris]
MQIRDYPVCKTRNHHHVSLRYFGHLRLTRQQEGSPPVIGVILLECFYLILHGIELGYRSLVLP